jgi:serine/threonine protein kinase
MQKKILIPHENHRYTLLKQINKTLYGGIFLAQDTLTKQLVALKQVDLLYAMHNIEVCGDLIDDPRQERVIAKRLREVSNPNKHVLKYLDDFIHDQHLYFVQEYCGKGDLLHQNC